MWASVRTVAKYTRTEDLERKSIINSTANAMPWLAVRFFRPLIFQQFALARGFWFYRCCKVYFARSAIFSDLVYVLCSLFSSTSTDEFFQFHWLANTRTLLCVFACFDLLRLRCLLSAVILTVSIEQNLHFPLLHFFFTFFFFPQYFQVQVDLLTFTKHTQSFCNSQLGAYESRIPSANTYWLLHSITLLSHFMMTNHDIFLQPTCFDFAYTNCSAIKM